MGSFLSSKFDPKADLVDMKGKVVVVTGGKFVIQLIVFKFCGSSRSYGPISVAGE